MKLKFIFTCIFVVLSLSAFAQFKVNLSEDWNQPYTALGGSPPVNGNEFRGVAYLAVKDMMIITSGESGIPYRRITAVRAIDGVSSYTIPINAIADPYDVDNDANTTDDYDYSGTNYITVRFQSTDVWVNAQGRYTWADTGSVASEETGYDIYAEIYTMQ